MNTLPKQDAATPPVENSSTYMIPLTQGKFAIVDAIDYERISTFKWYAAKEGKTWYAQRMNEQHSTEKMHRVIIDINDPLLQVDHRDRNGLNNQRSNLRIATRTQNKANMPKRADGVSSPYKGVSWNKNKRKWCSSIGVNRVRIHLGTFTDEIAAALAYDAAALKFFGEFSFLNFPSLSEKK